MAYADIISRWVLKLNPDEQQGRVITFSRKWEMHKRKGVATFRKGTTGHRTIIKGLRLAGFVKHGRHGHWFNPDFFAFNKRFKKVIPNFEGRPEHSDNEADFEELSFIESERKRVQKRFRGNFYGTAPYEK